MRGYQRNNAVCALRSLFRFAKKRGLIFTNPTAGVKARPIEPGMIPMTDTEIRAVEELAVSPAHRLVIALAAEHAARTGAIRRLMLDDLDLPNRRITIAGIASGSATSPTRRCARGSTTAARPGRTRRTGTS